MSENTSDFFEELDDSDMEMPLDGRDGQPPEEGSSDEPDTLAAHDPLRNKDVVLSDTHGPSTTFGQEAEPLSQDDWALEELHIVDPDELEDELEEEDDDFE